MGLIDVRRSGTRRAALGVMAVSGILSGAAGVRAHPHVWVTVESAVELGEGSEFRGLKQRWTFDAMYSSYALHGLDRNGDGRHTAEELAPLLKTMTSSMADGGYFTRAFVDGTDLPLAPPTGQALEVGPDGALSMTFALAPAKPTSLAGASLRIEVRDVEYYVDFTFSKTRFMTVSPADARCRARLDDGQPPQGASAEDLMNALISGPLRTLGSAIVLDCP